MPATLFTGHLLEKLDKIDSTNSYVLNLLKERPLLEGHTVWALEQFAGRGQRGNSWLVSPGTNLTFSIVLQPRFLPVNRQFWLTKAMALAVADFVSSQLGSYPLLNVSVKWPNDIYVNTQKIAGILIENVLEGSTIKYSVIGIGVNINQETFDPSVPNATSLKLLSGSAFELDDCLNNLFIPIEKFYLELRNGNYSKIDEAYHKILYRKGILSDLAINGKPMKGIIKGVSEEGHLEVETFDGGTTSVTPLQVSDVKHLVFL